LCPQVAPHSEQHK